MKFARSLPRGILAAGLTLSLSLAGGEAVSASFDYKFPVSECKTKYSRYHHDYPAVDIFARQSCQFIAPIGGVIDEVSREDKWSGAKNLGSTRGGKFVSLVGDDGVRYYGSHLRSVRKGIEPGVRVEAGESLGFIGSTGSARGTSPHLHFGISWPTEKGIWWVRRGVINPYDFLQSWQKGEDSSPAKAVKRAFTKNGGKLKEPDK